MLVSAAKRLVLLVAILAILSFVSFYFFAIESPPLRGHPPLHEYWKWLRGFGTGDSFRSLLTHESLWSTVLPALGHTSVLLATALLLVVALSLVISVAAALRRGSPLDLLLRGLSYLGWAVPAFLLALLVQLAVVVVGGHRGLGPFPIAGWPGWCPASIGLNAGQVTPCPPAGSGLGYALNVLKHVTLPGLTLAAGFVGLHGRYLRSSLLEALDAPYITTARMKGLSEWRVIVRHALPNSLVTFVSALLSDFGVVFGAALAVDWVFQMNGLGTLFLHQFPNGPAPIDTYLIELLLLLTGAFVLVSSLVGELAVARLDPRSWSER